MSLAVPDIMYYGIHFVDAQHGWMVGEYGNIRNTNRWRGNVGLTARQSARRAESDGVIASDVMSLAAFFRVQFH